MLQWEEMTKKFQEQTMDRICISALRKEEARNVVSYVHDCDGLELLYG